MTTTITNDRTEVYLSDVVAAITMITMITGEWFPYDRYDR